MPRNGSGVYSLPPGYEATTGQTAAATQHNDPLEDLKNDANAARPIVAGGTGATSASAARTNLGLSYISNSGIDTTVPLIDNSDPTVKFALDISANTTATTRTWVVPDFNDTFVGLTGAQTLTNKTLTAPVLTGIQPTITRLTSGAGATHNFQASTRRARIRQCGAGGAGGGADSDSASTDAGAGGGGGAGATQEFIVDVAALGITSFTYTIGAKGTGVGNSNGNNGGDTIYSDGTNTVTAGGGSGGAARNDTSDVHVAGGGNGGSPSKTVVSGITMLSEQAGQPGGLGLLFPQAALTSGKLAIGGRGGNTMFGPGGGETTTFSAAGSSNAGNAAPTSNSGAGGSGGSATGSTSSVAGGNGADGVMIIEEYPY